MSNRQESTGRVRRWEPPRILTDDLRACLRGQYALSPLTLEFLPLGHDYQAGVYRVVSEQGTAYLLKVTSRPLYEPGCLVPRHLQEQGIPGVVAPLPTRSGALWATLKEWTILVYPFLEGETSLTGMTSAQWQATGTIFQQIHQVPLPPEGFASLRQETFDPSTYTQWVQSFETHHLQASGKSDAAALALRASWRAHQSTIHTGVTTLEKLAAELKGRSWPGVLCHADLHPANLLRDQVGRVFVLDWDEVMLAPKERDFIFVCALHAEAFWEGYGRQERDWTALTYYLWERVVQDLIEYTHTVWFRNDVAEATREEAVQRFEANLAEGASILTAARESAAHLAR